MLLVCVDKPKKDENLCFQALNQILNQALKQTWKQMQLQELSQALLKPLNQASHQLKTQPAVYQTPFFWRIPGPDT